MGHTRNSIVVNAPYELVFDISNHIERWTELFGDEYVKAEVLSREGNRVEFRLTNNEGNSWTSFRLLFKEHNFIYAQKNDPMLPFQYMKIVWFYTPVEDGIMMTWVQDFEMDEKAKLSDKEVERFINKHSRDNLKIFKDIIEKEARDASPRA